MFPRFNCIIQYNRCDYPKLDRMGMKYNNYICILHCIARDSMRFNDCYDLKVFGVICLKVNFLILSLIRLTVIISGRESS